VLEAQGDLASTLAAYDECLSLRRAFAPRDPDNPGWQCDVSFSLESVGRVLKTQGELSGALAA
jgi:hypothetical protein